MENLESWLAYQVLTLSWNKMKGSLAMVSSRCEVFD